MKKFMLGILAVVIFMAFMPLNAQMPEKKIEPVEEPKTEPKEEPKDKPDAKKYDLKIIFTKGMVYDRKFKVHIKYDMDQQGMAMNSDAKIQFNSKITINDVKDNMPIDIKCEITEVTVEGEMPSMGMEEESNELDKVKSLKGHWFRIKKNAEGNFELVEKSKDFPEDNGDMFENISELQVMMFDSLEFPKTAVAVGESFKFNYKDKMMSKDILEGLSGGNELNEMKIKFDKVEEKDGIVIGHFSGKMEQEVDMMGTSMKITISAKVVHDITNNRCLQMDVVPSFEMSGEGFSMTMMFGMYNSNVFSKVEKKVEPKIAPKDEE